MSEACTATTVGDLAGLVPSWARSLRATNRSPKTLTTYVSAANQLIAFLAVHGMPTDAARVRREHVEAFIEDVLARCRPATASNRYRALARFFAYLVEEGEIRESPMARMKPPHVPEEPVPVLGDEEFRLLLASCDGRGFEERRDTAIVRLFLESGMRLSELANLRVEDLDLDQDVAIVVGKGRRPRACPFGSKTGQAIDRYLRVRSKHHAASQPWLWVGKRGRMNDSGVYQMIVRRAAQAGLDVQPAPAPSHLRGGMASGRWAGGRPHAPRWLAQPPDAQPLRRSDRRRAGQGGAPPAGPGGSPLTLSSSLRRLDCECVEVGLLRRLGASAPLVVREQAIGVDLLLEPGHERVARRLRRDVRIVRGVKRVSRDSSPKAALGRRELHCRRA